MGQVGREVVLLLEQPAQAVGAGVPEPEHVPDGDAVVGPVKDRHVVAGTDGALGHDPQVGTRCAVLGGPPVKPGS